MPRKKGQLAREIHPPTTKEPLPHCDGPKLCPFVGDTASLKFIRLLLDPTIDADAYVFEVSIGGQPYALKAVRRISSADLLNRR